MNGRSRMLVGASILAMGALTLWVAATQADRDVRYVEDLLFEAEEARVTLLGVPQPALVPRTTATGLDFVPNPHHANLTRHTTSWMREGERVFSTVTLAVGAEANGTLRWTYLNETRRLPADAAPLESHHATWWLGRAADVFPVVAFSEDAKVHPDTPRLWALYDRAPENPMQPKPSQFGGRLLAALPDGRPVPPGAAIFVVEEFTAGCSSKFLPTAYQE